MDHLLTCKRIFQYLSMTSKHCYKLQIHVYVDLTNMVVTRLCESNDSKQTINKHFLFAQLLTPLLLSKQNDAMFTTPKNEHHMMIDDHVTLKSMSKQRQSNIICLFLKVLYGG